MNNEISADQINSIMAVLNNAGTQAVEAYSRWHFIDALVWLSVGIGFLIAAILMAVNFKRIADLSGDSETGFWLSAGIVIFSVIGLLVVGCNITNLFEPTAYGIHQLIIDIRG